MVSGTNGRQRFVLRDVYCVPNLELSKVSQKGREFSKNYRHLRGLPLPDFDYVKPGLLIGLEHAGFLGGSCVYEGSLEDPLAAKTKLGWIVYGRHKSFSVDVSSRKQTKQRFQNVLTRLSKCRKEEDRLLHNLVKNFFAIESIGVGPTKLRSEEDARAEKVMESTLIFKNGRYEIGMTWKTDNETLPDNLSMAEQRCLAKNVS